MSLLQLTGKASRDALLKLAKNEKLSGAAITFKYNTNGPITSLPCGLFISFFVTQ